MLRRRPVRPLLGFRERIAIVLVIAACALSVHVGEQLAEGVGQVMSFEATTEAGVEAPGG